MHSIYAVCVYGFDFGMGIDCDGGRLVVGFDCGGGGLF